MKSDTNLLKELFDHVTESIIVTDEDGFIKLINPAATRLFGYEHDELYGKPIEELMPHRFRMTHVHNRQHYNSNPHSRSMGIGLDLYALGRNGVEFPVEISLSPFVMNGQKHIIVFLVDITRRKSIEDQVLRHKKELEAMTTELKLINERLEAKVQDRTKVLQEALNEIEKSRGELAEALEKEKELNELKSRFLSMASHEFRTPLTTIITSASLITEYPDSTQQDKRLKHVERIKSAVNNLNNILGDFLSLSKIEEGKVSAVIKEFDLPELVHEVKNEILGLCKQGQKLMISHKGDSLVRLDPRLVKNILINLISNAIKFSEENKQIWVSTSATASLLKIEVRDEGMGISKDDMEHLFQRFFRGENATNIQGTGLGLNIISKYVELLNGYIDVKSDLDKGTTFTLNFPTR
jgi:PAS domain S-box-containing protein